MKHSLRIVAWDDTVTYEHGWDRQPPQRDVRKHTRRNNTKFVEVFRHEADGTLTLISRQEGAWKHRS